MPCSMLIPSESDMCETAPPIPRRMTISSCLCQIHLRRVNTVSPPKSMSRSTARNTNPAWTTILAARNGGYEAYAIEELVAELGSVLLCARFTLSPEHFNSHAAYIGHWAEAIKTHPNALLSVAAHADKAVNYMLAFSVGNGLSSPNGASRAIGLSR